MSATRREQVSEEGLRCYRHEDTPTRLRCSRCDVPICGRCAAPASVGQHCPECVRDARKSAPKVRSAFRANAPAVLFILGLNAGVFVLQLALGDEFTARFALRPIEIAQGELYRLATPMFMHSPFFLLHVLFNSYVLYLLGPQVEQAFGTPRFVVLYLISGLMGSAASYTFSACNILGLGASGAIFGIVGVLLVFAFNRRRSALMSDYLRRILFFVGINLVFGFLFRGIDNAAHLGGLAGGVLLGLGFDQSGRGEHARPAWQGITALAVAGLALTLVAYRTATFSCGFPG